MILIVSNVILRDKLSVVRQQCLAEHYVIASSLIGDMQALEQRGNSVEENIGGLMRLYSRYLQGKGNGLAVSFSGEWIYESQSYAVWPEERRNAPPDTGYSQERLVYMENGKSPALCVYGSFPAPWQDYGLMYIGNLSEPIRSWRHTKNLLFLAGAGITLMMALFLFQFLNVIFRPLRQISSTSAKIANGNYGSRIPVQGKDEIAGVAHNFNLMVAKVERQIRQLAETAEQKQQFVDNFSHELRIPLTAIYGYAEYIQKAPVSEEERYECTQFIMSECSRLQHMAYQLLDMAFLRQEEEKSSNCSVKALFAQSEKAMQMKAMEKQVRLNFALSCDYIIRGNPEQLSHIKEAFYRVDKARSRAAGGAGLGLAICEKILKPHHADMSFASMPGSGTVVKILFPVE